MLYYLLIAFQAFCIFHVYKTRNEYYWYFVIFFVPIIGGIVYFFLQLINRRNINKTIKTISTVINPTKKIIELEKKLSFSDTFQNKINLADAHIENKDYEKAIIYYEKALNGKYENHPNTLNKALKCYFELKNFEKVVNYARKIDIEKSFNASLCIYAISLENCGFFEEAEIKFKKTDKRYSNYPERLELSKFLVRRDKIEDAKAVLNEVISEINNMVEINQKKYKYIYKESHKLMREI